MSPRSLSFRADSTEFMVKPPVRVCSYLNTASSRSWRGFRGIFSGTQTSHVLSAAALLTLFDRGFDQRSILRMRRWLRFVAGGDEFAPQQLQAVQVNVGENVIVQLRRRME